MSQLFEGRVFDRIYMPDLRSANFQVTASIPTGTLGVKHWYSPIVLDQGAYPHCVAYAGAGWLTDGPVCNPIGFDIPGLYREAQDLDQWAGNSYDGTSLLGLMKALKRRGYVSEYRWAFTLEQVRAHVFTTGPMVVGTLWNSDMNYPDTTGFIRIGGRNLGGHAYRIVGMNDFIKCPDGTVGGFRCKNNWSKAWGDQGRFWISYKDFAALLADDGEAATATEIRKGKA